MLRCSEHSDAEFEVLSAYPVPEGIRYFFGQAPAALFQLDLIYHDDPENPKACAWAFRNAAERHWGLSLDYEPEELPLVEELLLAALNGGSENYTRASTLDVLVLGLGCYVGEVLRRRAAKLLAFDGTLERGSHDRVLECHGRLHRQGPSLPPKRFRGFRRLLRRLRPRGSQPLAEASDEL